MLRLDKCYLDSAPSETTVKKWYADFKFGLTDTQVMLTLSSPKFSSCHGKHQKRQCTVSKVDRNDGKITGTAFRSISALNQFSISGPQRLLAVCGPQKNVPGKEIWLQ